MTPEEIKIKIQKAMSSFWWCSSACSIIERPEISYLIDPSGISNQVVRINDQHPQLEQLVKEFSEIFQNTKSSIITSPDQSKKLFQLLKKEGYEPDDLHDIRYQLVANHRAKQHKKIDIIAVKSREDLLKMHQTSAIAFGQPYQERPESTVYHMLKQANEKNPRVLRLLAVNKEDRKPIGIAAMSIFDDLGVATFFNGSTIPSARNQGVYTALTDSRIKYARQRGLSIIGIYANQKTSSPILVKQGFKKCGEMLPWTRKP